MEWNKKILLSIILSVFLISIVSARPITCADDPTELWHFNENNGTLAVDNCYGINATLNGDLNWTDGRYNSAVKFNEINTFVDAGNIFPFNQNMPEFSFSLWVNMSYNLAWQSIFRSGYYNLYSEFIELIQINDGGVDYILFMGASSLGNQSIDDSEWHHIAGTFNGTSQNATLYIDGVLINEVATGISEITTTTTPLYFGFNFDNGFLMNGSLDEVAFFNRTLTPSEVMDYYKDFNCSAQNSSVITLYIDSYPYLDLNASYNLGVSLLTDGISNNFTDVGMWIRNSTGSNFNFNFTWNETEQLYELNGLSFTELGSYSFTIFPYNPCKTPNITGTFRVYNPYYLTVKLLDNDNLSSLNLKYAQVLAEPTNINFTNEFVESFMYPLTYIKNPVFHANYTTDRAVIKLYDKGSYRIRVLNGDIKFNSTFSEPEIIDSYGINSYLGTVTTNGTNQTVTYAVGDKQLRQYFWIFNWILIIAIVFSIIIGIFLLFIVPQQPLLSLIFSFTMVISLCILRIVVWIYFQ